MKKVFISFESVFLWTVGKFYNSAAGYVRSKERVWANFTEGSVGDRDLAGTRPLILTRELACFVNIPHLSKTAKSHIVRFWNFSLKAGQIFSFVATERNGKEYTFKN